MRQDLQDRFSKISWESVAGAESRSGSGSSVKYTAGVRAALPQLFRYFNVQTFVDAPCGDWNWMQHVDLSGVQYIGLDIVDQIVAQNQAQHQRPKVMFGVADITSDRLPPGDLLMVRDCLFHLKSDLVWAFLMNFAAADIPFLFTTCYENPENTDIENGRFRELNLQAAPFGLERSIVVLREPREWWGNFSDRFMGVWSRAQVRDALMRRARHDRP